MNDWVCVKVPHHKDVAQTIKDHEASGWRLHTYTCAQAGMGEMINHYLLFTKEPANSKAYEKSQPI
ncbi:MAG: hypothetical protein NWF04_10060 [Candidatus Bathyarchaeota archaeon]|nr:hypothetical protein [Candidatus Bathyarchaeota archaeon]